MWLDVFQKIKALGFNCVSFYVDWALVEGKPGEYRAEGIFALEPFFEAAAQAGIYLLARPGPYINAEVSGGGFPGWLQRVNATLRTSDPAYLAATDKYDLTSRVKWDSENWGLDANSVVLAILPMSQLPFPKPRSRTVVQLFSTSLKMSIPMPAVVQTSRMEATCST